MKRIVFLFLLLLLLGGCRKKEKCIPHPDTEDIDTDLQVERLDIALMGMDSQEKMEDYINSHLAFKEFFLDAGNYPDDQTLYKNFKLLLKNPGIDTLYNEVQEVFSDFKEIETEFRNAFALMKFYYPEFSPPVIQTAITGISHDLYVSDSVVLIGLDYFLGNEATYQPRIPEYIRKRFRKETVVPHTILLMSNRYNQTDLTDNTLLADMIYYGKAYFFTRQILPCTPDSIIIGYSPEDIKNIERGKEIIWANFIENESLYETNHLIKDKFISERPKTFEIGEDCPGRIGRWLGWEIVKEYMRKNPDVRLQDLMVNKNAQEIFMKSRYKPKR